MVQPALTAEIATSVAAAIARSGRSKLSVAEATGIPYSTFNRKLNGHVDFNVPELFEIAADLRVAPWDLLPTSFKAVA